MQRAWARVHSSRSAPPTPGPLLSPPQAWAGAMGGWSPGPGGLAEFQVQAGCPWQNSAWRVGPASLENVRPPPPSAAVKLPSSHTELATELAAWTISSVSGESAGDDFWALGVRLQTLL